MNCGAVRRRTSSKVEVMYERSLSHLLGRIFRVRSGRNPSHAFQRTAETPHAESQEGVAAKNGTKL